MSCDWAHRQIPPVGACTCSECCFCSCSCSAAAAQTRQCAFPFSRYLSAGTIPKEWNAAGAFAQLSLLTLHYNNLTGDLPEPELWPQLGVL